MSKQDAHDEAIRRAVDKLKTVDLFARCLALKLPAPVGGRLNLRAFGADFQLTIDTFELLVSKTGVPAKDADHILILHLLLCESTLNPSDELITFRDFPGGIFYLEPFLSRTVRPLAKRYGNRLDELKAAMNRFDFQLLEHGDFSARIHAVGCLYVTLIYRLGDDEFPADAELFFNAPVKRVFCADDASVLAGRICFGLF